MCVCVCVFRFFVCFFLSKYTFLKQTHTVSITWCFTPSQPAQLYQGEETITQQQRLLLMASDLLILQDYFASFYLFTYSLSSFVDPPASKTIHMFLAKIKIKFKKTNVVLPTIIQALDRETT